MSDKSDSYSVYIPILLSLMVVVGMLIGRKMDDGPKTAFFSKREDPVVIEQPGKIEEILKYIDAQYVDSIDRNALTRTAIEAILDKLDPHSYYIDALEYKEINEQMKGSFEGIGIEYVLFRDTLIVADVMEDGPSERANLKVRDRILSVGDSSIAGKKLSQDRIKSLIKGKQNTEVFLQIQRPGIDSLLNIEVVRGEIPIESIPVAYPLTSNINYIKIRRFSSKSYDDFVKSLEQFEENGSTEHLIIDLRGNPGGYLKEAVKVLSQLFEEKGKLLVYTKGEHVPLNEYRSTGRNFFDIGRVAVIIDEYSASASEIMAGAIQDWDRGVVIGRRSYGKGLVQQQYDLRDGSALRLTVAKYYTPIGRLLQRDYGNLEAYDHAFKKRFHSGELFSEDSIPQQDTSLRRKTFDGRPVYGGEGIVPDIFIPLDSSNFDTAFVRAKNLVLPFILTSNDQELLRGEFSTSESYSTTFDVGDELFDSFQSFARKRDIAVEEWNGDNEQELKSEIKAALGDLMYNDELGVRIRHQYDKAVLTAVQALQSDDPLSFEHVK